MIAFILLLFLRSKQQWKLWWDFFSPKLRRKKYVNWYCREGLFCLTLFCIQIQVSSERRRRRKLLVNFFVARPSNLLLRTSDWFFSFFFVKSITFANCSNAIYITCFASVRNNDCRNFFSSRDWFSGMCGQISWKKLNLLCLTLVKFVLNNIFETYDEELVWLSKLRFFVF